MKIFIPIKEKSQRVPNKNFREFRGKKLYQYVLDKFNTHFELHIDTDSDEIYNYCKSNDIDFVTYRNPELVGHDVAVNSLIKEWMNNQNIKEPFFQIHVTSPLLEPKTLLEITDEDINKYSSLIGCDIIYNRFWQKGQNTNIYTEINHNRNSLRQTQDLNPLYMENSTFYLIKPQTMNEYNNRIGHYPKFIEVPSPQNLDIDTEDDWNLIKKYDNK